MQATRSTLCTFVAGVTLLPIFIASCLHSQTFYNPRQVPLGEDPIQVMVADFNGDSIPDLAYTMASTGTTPVTIYFLFGQAGGGYMPGPSFALPPGVGGCQPLDANNDGKIDFACLQLIDDFDMEIAYFQGNGDGTFQNAVLSAPMESDAPVNGFIGWLFAPLNLRSKTVPDLLVGDILDGWVFVLTGDGTGKFTNTEVLTYPQPTQPTASDRFFAVDLNGDGKPDLFSSIGPTVWLGNGDGTFAKPSTYGTYYSCLLNDIEKTGHPDAVCGGTYINQPLVPPAVLAILHGNADGSFNTTPVASQTYGSGAFSGYGTVVSPLAVLDVNGDGIPDILSYSGEGLGVLLGQGDLKFADPVHYAVGFLADGGEPSSVFGKFGGQGAIDLVSTGPNGLYFTLSNKDGTFQAPPAYEVANNLEQMTVADFNGDGIPDVVASGDQSLELSLGNGDGTFKPFVAIPSSGVDFSSALSIVLHGDFRGTGHQDILALGASGSQGNEPFILFNNGDGTFGAPQLLSNSIVLCNPEGCDQWENGRVIDINKDGRDDVLNMDLNHIYFAISNGDGSFNTVTTDLPVPSNWDGGSNPTAPAFADFNEDGKLDAVYSVGPEISILKGHGDGTFDSTGITLLIPTYQGQNPRYPIALATGDFDGDGHADFAVLVQYDGNVPGVGYSPAWGTPLICAAFVYYGKGDGTFSAPVFAGAFDQPYVYLYASDLNKDGLTDLVMQTSGLFGFDVEPAEDAIGAVLSLPGRFFGPVTDYAANETVAALNLVDLNHDGYPDILAGNGNFQAYPANSATELLNVGPAAPPAGNPTTTSVIVLFSPVNAGSPASFLATVSSPSPAGPAPTGSIEFVDQTGVRQSVPLAATSPTTATASFSTSQIAVGPDSMSATYSGDANYAPSSAQVGLLVLGYPLGMSFTAAPFTVQAGSTIALTATLINGNSSIAQPRGYFAFMDGSTILAQPETVTNGTFSFNTTMNIPGVHQFTATYSGDALYQPISATATAVVQGTPTVTETFSTTSIIVTQSVSVQAVVDFGIGAPIPTGTVTVTGGGYTSPPVALGGGQASITIPGGALSLGSDGLTTTYVPDSASSVFYNSASSPDYVVIVNPVPQTFSLSATNVTVSPGSNGQSTITLSPSGGFTGSVMLSAVLTAVPTGAVDYPTLTFGEGSQSISVTGSGSVTAQLSVFTTAASTTALRPPARGRAPWFLTFGSTLACVLLVFAPRRARDLRCRIGVILLLAIAFACIESCGGAGTSGTGGGGGGGTPPNPGTTPGTYTVTVSGTGNAVTASTTFTLDIQ